MSEAPHRSEDSPDRPRGPESGTPAADRRSGDRRREDRRQAQVPVPVDRRSGDDRRVRPERRRSINQYDLGNEELDFINAINRFKERTGRPFPTWSEVLRILKELGYEKQT